jgi:hypothetical protein
MKQKNKETFKMLTAKYVDGTLTSLLIATLPAK